MRSRCRIFDLIHRHQSLCLSIDWGHWVHVALCVTPTPNNDRRLSDE